MCTDTEELSTLAFNLAMSLRAVFWVFLLLFTRPCERGVVRLSLFRLVSVWGMIPFLVFFGALRAVKMGG